MLFSIELTPNTQMFKHFVPWQMLRLCVCVWPCCQNKDLGIRTFALNKYFEVCSSYGDGLNFA